MLGAYQPKQPVLIQTANAISQLQSELNKAEPTVNEARNVIKDWLEANGQALANMYIEDFNSKMPPRGQVPEVKVKIDIHSNVPQSGQYDPATETATFFPINLARYRNECLRYFLGMNWLYPERYRGDDSEKERLVNAAVAAFTVGTLMHEALHHIQLFHIDKELHDDRNKIKRMIDDNAYDIQIYPYYFSNAEAAAWSVTSALIVAATIPPKYYSSINGPSLKSISNYIKSRNMIGIFGESEIPKIINFGSDEDVKRYKIFQVGELISNKNQLKREVLLSFTEEQVNNSSGLERTIKDIEESEADSMIDLKFKFYMKNYNRYLRHFEAINRILSPNF
jgi:hypothetical protein